MFNKKKKKEELFKAEVQKPKFCPLCHRRVLLPDMFNGIEDSKFKDIVIGCNNCGKGVVVFFSSKGK